MQLAKRLSAFLTSSTKVGFNAPLYVISKFCCLIVYWLTYNLTPFFMVDCMQYILNIFVICNNPVVIYYIKILQHTAIKCIIIYFMCFSVLVNTYKTKYVYFVGQQKDY